MNNKVVLAVGAALIAVGIFKPDLSNLFPGGENTPVVVTPDLDFTEPTDPSLLAKADEVTAVLKAGGDNRKADGMALARLYKDIATLISLDQENAVVKTTSEIREVNSVAGTLMNLQLKGRYENLASTAKELVVSVLGDDVATLNEENREKAVAAFEALAWGCYMGAK
jgi:hypothetical protein